VETPILTKSTPEGARDYLVPSRVHPGKFYALPQSPQQYKQLLMLAGVDRYLQITRCMRDEDLRADRQPEFTQVDLEMSFIEQNDVMDVCERYIAHIFKSVTGAEITLPLTRMSYDEAMSRYGSDKPDLRFGFEIVDITDIAAGCGFQVFAGTAQSGGGVRAIKIDGAADKLGRKEIDALGDFVKTYKAKGLAWAKLSGGEYTSSYAKFLTEDENKKIFAKTGACDGDLLFIVADADSEIVLTALGALRCEMARRLGLLQNKKEYKMLWIVDFPLFEYSAEDERLVARHHPFTSPQDDDVCLLETQPAKMKAKAYDFVVNGYELGGGSIRIHDTALQSRMFRALGFGDAEIQSRFGHLVEAFKYGAPPHGGIAFGLDRMVMLLTGTEDIKDVIAFPKTQNASEIMMSSPDVVDEKQLRELGIKLDIKQT